MLILKMPPYTSSENNVPKISQLGDLEEPNICMFHTVQMLGLGSEM